MIFIAVIFIDLRHAAKMVCLEVSPGLSSVVGLQADPPRLLVARLCLLLADGSTVIG